MTKEEIIRLMRESVKDHSEYRAGAPDPEGEDLEVFVKFAELVIAVEREACELRCAKTPVLIPGHHEYTALKVQAMMMEAVSMRTNSNWSQT